MNPVATRCAEGMRIGVNSGVLRVGKVFIAHPCIKPPKIIYLTSLVTLARMRKLSKVRNKTLVLLKKIKFIIFNSTQMSYTNAPCN